MNLVEILQNSRRCYGEKVAITRGEHRITYSELDDLSSRFASALQTSGIQKGDRAALLIGNSPEFLTAYFGTIKAGAVAVLLDPKYKAAELSQLLADSQPRVLVSEKSCLEHLLTHREYIQSVELFIDAGPEPCGDTIAFADFLNRGSEHFSPPIITDTDLAHIAYTSGPSFDPHGVMARHGNLAQEIQISATSFAQTENDVVVQFALPLHHVIGLTVVMLTSLYCGSSVILLDGVSTDNLASTIEHNAVSMFLGVPFIHAMVVRKAEEGGIQHRLRSLRVCGSAGDILPPIIVNKYRELLGLRLINLYGLTETLGHVTCQRLKGSLKPGSVGPALPGWNINIVDANGSILPANQPGEVRISGPMMAGYYNKPNVNRAIMRDGWLHTGDRGMLDADGELHILGLQKDMLICKGQNIFPSDIERVLSQHPSVAEVAVVGIPDEMRGEVVGAAVVLRTGVRTSETALLKYCLERMANYKAPKYFSFLNFLPVTSDGKIDKSALKEHFTRHNFVSPAEK